MLLALECPIPLMDKLQPYADFDFILTHLVADYDYRKFYVESSRFSILDNSTNELRKPCSIDEILHAAELVHPDYICPPDFLGDMNRTITALEEMEKLTTCSILPIIQGSNDKETAEFMGYLVGRGYTCVAVPYDITGSRTGDLVDLALKRSNLVDILAQHFDWIHLLGLTQPNELLVYGRMPNVRSLDTGSPITNGLHHRRYGSEVEPLPKTTMLDFDQGEMLVTQERDVLHNIAYVRQLMIKEEEWLI